jgi:hypothetical protein
VRAASRHLTKERDINNLASVCGGSIAAVTYRSVFAGLNFKL